MASKVKLQMHIKISCLLPWYERKECRDNRSLVKFVLCRHSALMQLSGI